MFFYSLLARTFYSTHRQGLSLLSVAVKTASVIHGLGAACLMREMCSADQFSFSCAAPAELQFRLCQRSNVWHWEAKRFSCQANLQWHNRRSLPRQVLHHSLCQWFSVYLRTWAGPVCLPRHPSVQVSVVAENEGWGSFRADAGDGWALQHAVVKPWIMKKLNLGSLCFCCCNTGKDVHRKWFPHIGCIYTVRSNAHIPHFDIISPHLFTFTYIDVTDCVYINIQAYHIQATLCCPNWFAQILSVLSIGLMLTLACTMLFSPSFGPW